jgi:hypothetical protein
MNRRAASMVAVLLVAVACLAGCSSSGGTSTQQPSKGHTSPVAASSPSPMLTPTASVRTPLGAGERVWAAFSHRGLSYDDWWAQLKPLLSEAARAVYVYDDPRKLPSMTLSGKLHLAAHAPDEAKYTAEVVVPTSKGEFALDLERHTVKSPWLLYAIKFPPGVR